MFHRRLALLAGVMAFGFLLLAAQMMRLAVVHGAEHYETAERRLRLVQYLPTTRGRILDRNDVALAVDRPSFEVAVEYEVITGAWSLQQAARAARSEIGGSAWEEMGPEDRDAAVTERLPAFQDKVDELWTLLMRFGGIDRSELDRRLDAIKRDVKTLAAVVWAIQFGRDGADPATVRRRPIREQRQAHVLLPRVPDLDAYELRRKALELPGLIVRDSHRREYPWFQADVLLDRLTLPRVFSSTSKLTIHVEGVADHILGAMRNELWADDVGRRPFRDRKTGNVDLRGYRPGDSVGLRGLERTFEDSLRGRRGVMRKRLDKDETEREPYEPGEDLRITIDIELQAHVQAIMTAEYGLTTVQQYQVGWNVNGTPRKTGLPIGTPLNSAAVVLDIQSGEILAMVSMPTLATGQTALNPFRKDGQRPVNLNRPVEATYPPGSIAKPLVMVAALSEGLHDITTPIECVGHYLAERRDIARCWCYRPPSFTTHGSLTASEAIARSCNIYFYTMGDRLGMARLSDWYRRFGVGRPLDIGLLDETGRGENGGAVPSPALVERLRKAGELHFASIIMGIGQGPVTWTPLHAANAYATLARRGTVRSPTLVRGRDTRPTTLVDLSLDETMVSTVLDGMRRSVSEDIGTGHHITYPDGRRVPIINAPGVTVWAKTGTAQATAAAFDLDGDGTPDIHLDNPTHAWFVGLVGPADAPHARPRYAIAVLVEYGGSGGRTAGPIANEIIRALTTHGYLSDDAT